MLRCSHCSRLSQRCVLSMLSLSVKRSVRVVRRQWWESRRRTSGARASRGYGSNALWRVKRC